ncbi:MAG: L-fucose/L-arabinose isomerase family protein [Candidatus Limiplasma sp.]|nr:L-fucose/L-arabinose isomerase family protein [Candidatus Limiplasma sp.]
MLGKPLIGIIGVSDGEPEVHETLKDVVQKQVDVITAALQRDGRVDVIQADCLVHSVQTAKEQAELLKQKGVDGTVISHGVFAFPNFSAIIAKNGKGPFMLCANLFPDWPGMVSMLAAGGALDHLGIDHFRAAGDFNNPDVLEKVVEFARCAHVVSSLNGEKYGLIGGRSLGMYSATVSMQDWQERFGVDVDHLDQSEILRFAAQVPEEKVEKAFQWLTQHCASIAYDQQRLTPEKLKTQIRHYEALKRIVAEHQYDFVGVKCHYEMSRHYCTECIAAAFMNDPYDWDGPKEPVVYACEADSDAALTMQILKLLTHDPVLFMDVRHYDAENDVMVFCNCGSQSTYYAGGSQDPAENLKQVKLYPCLEIYAGGGCHVNCMTRPGKATIARLNRYKGEYRMTVFTGEIVQLPQEKMAETTMEWPHNYVKLSFDHEVFLEKFSANHCHAVYGDHVKELKMICRMLGIPCEMLGGEGRQP